MWTSLMMMITFAYRSLFFVVCKHPDSLSLLDLHRLITNYQSWWVKGIIFKWCHWKCITLSELWGDLTFEYPRCTHDETSIFQVLFQAAPHYKVVHHKQPVQRNALASNSWYQKFCGLLKIMSVYSFSSHRMILIVIRQALWDWNSSEGLF